MAEDNKKPMVQFSDFVTEVQDWMTKATDTHAGKVAERPWCVLKIPELTKKEFATYFDRKTIGEVYKTGYETLMQESKPYAFLQMESDLIFSMHRGFMERHRGRMMTYRDACAQQKYHTFSSISLGLAKYDHSKNLAEQKLENTESV